jgi:hypothetical protein
MYCIIEHRSITNLKDLQTPKLNRVLTSSMYTTLTMCHVTGLGTRSAAGLYKDGLLVEGYRILLSYA